MRHSDDGAVLDVGRRTRTVPPSIRRALLARDGTCRFPGCISRRCDAHHIEHWLDGGETSLGNLVLLCRRHHRSVPALAALPHPAGRRAVTASRHRHRIADRERSRSVAPGHPIALQHTSGRPKARPRQSQGASQSRDRGRTTGACGALLRERPVTRADGPRPTTRRTTTSPPGLAATRPAHQPPRPRRRRRAARPRRWWRGRHRPRR